MNIGVKVVPSATWEWEGGAFYCTHDEGVELETVEVDTMRQGEHDTYETTLAFCADPDCGEEQPDYIFDNY